MRSSSTPWAFVLVIAAAAGFVWLTGQRMPPLVAAHFGVTGAANGYMARPSYLKFMMVFVVLLPLALTVAMGWALRIPGARINLPDRDYWLAPERRTATIAVLLQYMRVFGTALVVFLCYVHWLVVQANDVQPPALDNRWMVGGLLIFLALVIGWTVALRRRFRREESVS